MLEYQRPHTRRQLFKLPFPNGTAIKSEGRVYTLFFGKARGDATATRFFLSLALGPWARVSIA